MAHMFTSNGIQHFSCESDAKGPGCGKEFTRPAGKGQPPKRCPECRGVKAHREKRAEVREIEIIVEDFEHESEYNGNEDQHAEFATLLAVVKAGVAPMLIGPAGSGKTYAGRLVAKEMGLEFFTQSCSADMTSVDLSGFVAAGGDYTETALYRAFRDGGVYLLDEMDAGTPGALVWANAILASAPGETITFPGGETVMRSEHFYPIAATNTNGHGATRDYAGRQVLDGATLNRFAKIMWGYDERLEMRLASEYGDAAIAWCKRVQAIRKAAETARAGGVIATPRNTLNGARMLAAGGLTVETVENLMVWNGMAEDTKRTILAHI